MQQTKNQLISGKDGNGVFYHEPLDIDFDKNAKLEYKARATQKGWNSIDAYTFRSWGGPRRIDGKEWHGAVWYLGSNEISRSASN